MKSLLKEPLLHFLLLGTGLFIAYGLLSQHGRSSAPGTIVVTLGRVEHLATGFAKTWQRPPTDAELAGLIDDWVREEIATREAMALGLHEDDTVIRRRLRQKLEFVSEDIVAQVEPTDADLYAYLQAHPEAFRDESRFTFSQVYLDPARHGQNVAADAARVLASLRQTGAKADIAALGDSFLLESTFQSVTMSDVARQFGEEFAVALDKLPPGEWQGPIASGYGVHLVWVDERTEERLPEFAAVRDVVRREWENAQRLDGNRKFYERLQQRYTVTIERAEPAK